MKINRLRDKIFFNMELRTRLILLLACSLAFIVLGAYIVLYSVGYAIDFGSGKIVATGGVYVRAEPLGCYITIDDNVKKRTSLFADSVFVQNLLPAQHRISIAKEGYFDYQKTLPVKGNEVTKLENVILIKKDISFANSQETSNYISVSPNENFMLSGELKNKKINIKILDLSQQPAGPKALLVLPGQSSEIIDSKWSGDSNRILIKTDIGYFIFQPFLEVPSANSIPYLADAKDVNFNPQNSDEIFFLKSGQIYFLQNLANQDKAKITSIAKNAAAYQITNDGLIWLSSDGFIYKSNISGDSPQKQNSSPFKVSKNVSYKIAANSEFLFLIQGDGQAYILKNGSLEFFSKPVKDIKFSPDGRKLVIINNNEISFFKPLLPDIFSLFKSSEKITGCFWINNNYILFKNGSGIAISETDYRGNVNVIQLPQKILLQNGEYLNLANPDIFYASQRKKLYLLNSGKIFESEKIIP